MISKTQEDIMKNWNMGTPKNPYISVQCFAYNHEDYISQALDGILMQETKYAFEIIVHDDASTDRTAEIIKEYEKKYPLIIKAIYQTENQYSKDTMSVTKIVNEKSIGKYIALCEGDDYWIDSSKLKKQIDYLESHKECVLVGHNAEMIDYSTGKNFIMNPNNESGQVMEKHIILEEKPSLPTASLVYRSEVKDLEKFFTKCGVGDVPLKLFALTKGYVYYFKEVMSVYRFMHNGSWSKNALRKEIESFKLHIRMIEFFKKYNSYTNNAYEKFVYKKMYKYLSSALSILLEKNDEECQKLCSDVIESIGKQYVDIIEECKRIRKEIKIPQTRITKIKRYCEKNTNLWIWGTGKYSAVYLEQLQELGIDIQGHIVSENIGGNEHCGKPICEARSFPYDKGVISVIIAVNIGVWPEVYETLVDSGFDNYYCSYMIC